MAYESALEEELGLRFLSEELPKDRDEVDSISKHVISFEREATQPRYFVNREKSSENRGIKKETKRLRMISEKTIKSFQRRVPFTEDGVVALLTFQNSLAKEQVKKLPSILVDICPNAALHVLYHSSNHVILHMKTACYTALGDRIVKGNGFNIQNMILTDLEALRPDPVPNYFVGLSTPKSAGESIQSQLSSALVAFCGSFKYLRLYEGKQPDIKPANPSVGLTLLFSKRAQASAAKLSATLSDERGTWMRYQPPEAVRVPFEELYLLKDHSAPIIGLIGGNDLPGIRISVRFSSKQQDMLEFYRVVTGKDPVRRSDRTGTSYTIFPVARNIELQLIYNSTIDTQPSCNISICLRIQDHEKIAAGLRQPLIHIDAGHWETCDPVGNSVRLFTPFECKA